MPMVWRVLLWINHLNEVENLDIGLSEIADVYDLRNFGSSHISFKIITGKDHLFLNISCHNVGGKESISLSIGNLWKMGILFLPCGSKRVGPLFCSKFFKP